MFFHSELCQQEVRSLYQGSIKKGRYLNSGRSFNLSYQCKKLFQLFSINVKKHTCVLHIHFKVCWNCSICRRSQNIRYKIKTPLLSFNFFIGVKIVEIRISVACSFFLINFSKCYCLILTYSKNIFCSLLFLEHVTEYVTHYVIAHQYLKKQKHLSQLWLFNWILGPVYNMNGQFKIFI